MALTIRKKYLYKIYDINGNYLTTWNDVTSDPNFSAVLNGGVGELVVKRAVDVFSYGETVDVAIGNQLKLYVFDIDNLPAGTLIYTGEITRYIPKVEGKDQWVEITFLGYIGQLSRTILEGNNKITTLPYNSYDPSDTLKSVINLYRFKWGATVGISQLLGGADGAFGDVDWYAQEIITSAIPADNLIAGISLRVKYHAATAGAINIQIRTDDGGSPSKPTTIILRHTSVTLPTTQTAYAWVDFIFDEPYQLDANTHYWIVFDSSASNVGNAYEVDYKSGGSVYAGDLAYSNNSGSTWTTSANDDFAFKVYYVDGQKAKINYNDWQIRDIWNHVESPALYNAGFGQNYYRAMSFTADKTTTIHSVKFQLKYNTGTAGDINVELQGNTGGNVPDNTPIGSGTLTALTDTTGRWYEVVFQTPISITVGTTYWWVWKSTGASTTTTYYLNRSSGLQSWLGGNNASSSDGGSTWSVSSRDIFFINYTEAPSIDETLTTTSYVFNSNTAKEGLDKCLEMSPATWYWYLDNNLNIQFHAKSSSVVNTFTMGKDIETVDFENRSENIINRIYFNGGDTPVLFRRYEDTGSISSYGLWEIVKSDGRLTDSSSMDIIGNAMIANFKDSEIRTQLTVFDNNYINIYQGYNIESIFVGQTINVKGLSRTIFSLWDVMKWDIDPWDYQLSNISDVNIIIQQIAYAPDHIDITASSRLPDINKRIEDIARNLTDNLTVNNPSRTLN